MSNRIPLFLVVIPLLAALGGCTSQALCEKARECASDPPGEDFVRICTITNDGQVRAYRANKEEECHVLADAKLAYDACRAQLDCDDFREGDHNGECDQERDDWEDAFRDAEQECGTAD